MKTEYIRIDSDCPTCAAGPGEPCWWSEYGTELGPNRLHKERTARAPRAKDTTPCHQ